MTKTNGRMIEDGSIGTADLADGAVTPDKLSFTAPDVDTPNTFNADQAIRSVDAGAAEGPLLQLVRDSPSPAAADLLGALPFLGRDSTDAVTLYAKFGAELVDPTNASEDARLFLATIIAGTFARRFEVGAGLFATGQTDPGAGLVNAAGFQRQGAALPFQVAYTSANQTITAAGQLTLAHGLGAMPALVQLRLKCLTAELGYSIGDELVVSAGVGDAAGNRGISAVPDATNVVVRFGSDAASFSVIRKDTGVAANITNANWALIVRAWA